ncbi:MAG: glycerol-3-phosphate dehydrogenase/oxidase [Thermoleophilaceae bacterium]|nr:glycerol-3-phosphate dehydrogenase/oxidase [Thermoleophilaceae bacterium]
MNASPDLSTARRAQELQELAGGRVDLVVIGGGITGCGVALDAASRGLSVALLERHDLAHGTSRWSSKLVHGGLRYLAQGQIGVAAESARERHHLITSIAPHLVRPLATVIPFTADLSRSKRATLRIGYKLGDGLRRGAGTSSTVLDRSRRVDADDATTRIPALSRDGLGGALIGWDGQLEDDARLVVAVARTAAAHGAKIITRCAVTGVERGAVHAEDSLTGEAFSLEAAHVINAAGVWAGELATDVKLTPSKGSHIIVPAKCLGHPTGSLTVPALGGGAKYVFAIPTPDETVMIGLTDTEFEGAIPDLPVVEEWEIELLLATISSVLDAPLERADVIGSFAGLRPLLQPSGSESSGATADVSREHQVIEDAATGMLSVVGGKLTTYRRMAEDAVDQITDRTCVTRTIALIGAGGARPADRELPDRLKRRYGAEAARVAGFAENDVALLNPAADGTQITGAELRFAAVSELAMTTEDLLDRRTRAGLTPELRTRLEPAANAALEWASQHQSIKPEGVARGNTAASN